MQKVGIFFGYFEYIMAIWHSFWLFGNLVAIWYLFPHLSILCQEKSGNPVQQFASLRNANTKLINWLFLGHLKLHSDRCVIQESVCLQCQVD
jgi:cytochrome b subunit of formate dehydrogenase